ncbi:MAG: GNAT family N-acetyltransferase [Planctomycetota bacterium]|nr:GNAT family N-acetyltransferase [Planctomycetota bacterium]
MNIRQMKPGDMTRIVAITESAWGDVTVYKLLEDRYGPIGRKGWKQKKADEVQALFGRISENVIVAVEDDKVVGYASFTIDAEDKVGHVHDNAVDPEYQGRGIGSAMNKWVLDHFGREGVKIARVSTLLHDKAARRVYEKNGFEELARTIHYSMRISENQ